jgi:hypothetical protein
MPGASSALASLSSSSVSGGAAAASGSASSAIFIPPLPPFIIAPAIVVLAATSDAFFAPAACSACVGKGAAKCLGSSCCQCYLPGSPSSLAPMAPPGAHSLALSPFCSSAASCSSAATVWAHLDALGSSSASGGMSATSQRDDDEAAGQVATSATSASFTAFVSPLSMLIEEDPGAIVAASSSSSSKTALVLHPPDESDAAEQQKPLLVPVKLPPLITPVLGTHPSQRRLLPPTSARAALGVALPAPSLVLADPPLPIRLQRGAANLLQQAPGQHTGTSPVGSVPHANPRLLATQQQQQQRMAAASPTRSVSASAVASQAPAVNDHDRAGGHTRALSMTLRPDANLPAPLTVLGLAQESTTAPAPDATADGTARAVAAALIASTTPPRQPTLHPRLGTVTAPTPPTPGSGGRRVNNALLSASAGGPQARGGGAQAFTGSGPMSPSTSAATTTTASTSMGVGAAAALGRDARWSTTSSYVGALPPRSLGPLSPPRIDPATGAASGCWDDDLVLAGCEGTGISASERAGHTFGTVAQVNLGLCKTHRMTSAFTYILSCRANPRAFEARLALRDSGHLKCCTMTLTAEVQSV